MPSLVYSKDPKDKEIVEFAKKQGIRTLSYKDYKYLYCLLCAEKIGMAIGGSPMKQKDKQMELWLSIARSDRANEVSGKAGCPKGVPANFFKELKPLLEAEVRAKDLFSLVIVRERIGEIVSSIFIQATDGKKHEVFWRNITVSMMLLDTLSDMVKDRIDGLVKKLDFRGFWLLIGKLAKSSFSTITRLGFGKSLKLLFLPAILTIKGGFESESKKEKEWELY
ncbi:MAG: hypothetical protein QW275_03015 [Candidatus Anstonellaceae archaeon]